MASIKQKRLEGIIRKNLMEILQFDVKDPNVGFVTITDVKVTNDHSYAKVYVSFIGATNRKEALAALERAKGFIRSELSQRLDIRRCPDLIFEIDKAEENARHIDQLIEEIHKNDSESGSGNEAE
ncbi:MAG: 30S ribosome-binding factor RbfA [Solobacterium sp.]|nr:30S ribosome-binding factor RbfA [Solobacterium sp.]